MKADSFPSRKIRRLTGFSEQEIMDLNMDSNELVAIYNDYLKKAEELKSLALYFVNRALGFSKVHSVRYRIKDADHLIAKIIRKKKTYPDRIINVKTYQKEITDLIGIRILHLFKKDAFDIDQQIRANFQLTDRELPTLYYRRGDVLDHNIPSDIFQAKEHQRGYRSVHYILESTPNIITHSLELQVRTLFEEGWSEIDHKMLYPNNVDHVLLNQFTMLLNGLAGGADSLATLMEATMSELWGKDIDHDIEIFQRDKKIKELEEIINKSNLTADNKEEVKKGLWSINRNRSSMQDLGKNLSKSSNIWFDFTIHHNKDES